MANFLEDTFTEGSDTALESHTPDVAGGQWTTDWDGNRFDIVAATDMVKSDRAAAAFAPSEPTPGSADYWCMVRAATNDDGTAKRVGAGVRMDAAANDGYCLYNRGNDDRYLVRVVTDSESTIDTDAWGGTSSTFYHIKLQAEGTGATVTLSMWYKGTSEPGGAADDTYADTDAARLTGTDKAGLYIRGVEPRIDSVKADVVAAGVTVPDQTLSPTSQLSNSGGMIGVMNV